jgi:midasin
LLDSALSQFTLVRSNLTSWLARAPELEHALQPLRTWFEAKVAALPSCGGPPELVTGDDTDRVINTLLVTVQNLISACPKMPEAPSDETEESPDNYVRETSRSVSRMTRSLSIEVVVVQINDVLRDLAHMPTDVGRIQLGRFMPFLEEYVRLVQEQLACQNRWARVLFKFEYILASTALTVAEHGFCKPPDTEESNGDGEGVEMADGVGLGAGEGAENVSKEIEDESQVEGLQGEQDDSEEKQDRSEDDDAIEMSEDVGGEMHDVEEGDAEEGEQSEDEADDERPEEALGKLDPSDPSAVDEKLWGDEEAPQEQGDEQKTEEESTKQEGDSEMVAKNEEQKKSKEKNDKKEEKSGEEGKEDGADDEKKGEKETEEDEPEEELGEPSGAGAPMEEHIPEANNLELPDDIDLGTGEDIQEDQDLDMDEDATMDEEQVDPSEIPEDVESEDADRGDDTAKPSEQEDENMDAEDKPLEEPPLAADAPQEGDEGEERDGEEAATAQPDVSSGKGEENLQSTLLDHEVGESASTGQSGGAQRAQGDDAGDHEGAPETERYARQPNFITSMY